MSCTDCGHVWDGPGYDQSVHQTSCPNCGGYRTQVPPTHSEMEMRDMPAPGEADTGGNPLQEGILADGGWQNRMKRDESFASVKKAEVIQPQQPQQQLQHPQGPSPIPYVNPIQSITDYDHMIPSPQEMERLRIEQPDVHAGWTTALALRHQQGMFENVRRDNVNAPPLTPGTRKPDPLNQPLQQGYSPIESSNRTRMYLPWDADSTRIATDFDVEQVIEPGPASGEVDVGQENPLILQHDDPSVVDNAKQQLEEYTAHLAGFPWEPPEEFAGMACPACRGVAGNTSCPTCHGKGELGAGQENRDMPSVDEHALPNLMLDPSNQQGYNMSLPGVPVRQGKTAGLFTSLLGSGVGGAAGAAIGTALMPGVGTIAGRLIGGAVGRSLAGGGGQQPQQAAPALNQPGGQETSWSSLSSIHSQLSAGISDLSNPGYDDTDDPEDVDQHEVNDGDHSQWQKDPSVNDDGGTSNIAPEVMQAVEDAEPALLKYMHSDESGGNDPAIAQLVQLLQAHHPEILEFAHSGESDPEIDELLDSTKIKDEPSAVGTKALSAVPGIGGMMPAPGTQQLAPAGPQNAVNPMSQGSCPHCGAMVTPGQGVCPQCNSAVGPAAAPVQNTAVNPQAPVGPAGQAMQPVMAATPWGDFTCPTCEGEGFRPHIDDNPCPDCEGTGQVWTVRNADGPHMLEGDQYPEATGGVTMRTPYKDYDAEMHDIPYTIDPKSLKGRLPQQVMRGSIHEAILAERLGANQGPHNLEQVQAVVEYLKAQGQDYPGLAEDITAHPENYGEILAEIQGKGQPPNPDPDPGPAPMPDPTMMGGQGMPPPGAPGGAGGMPQMMGAFQDVIGPQSLEEDQLQSQNYPKKMQTVSCPSCGISTTPSLGGCPHCGANFHPDLIRRAAADPITPPCPKCTGHSTGMITDDGRARCTTCKHEWDTQMDVQGDKTPVSVTGSTNEVLALDRPIEAHIGYDDGAQEQPEHGFITHMRRQPQGLETFRFEPSNGTGARWIEKDSPHLKMQQLNAPQQITAFEHDTLHDHTLDVPSADQARPDDPSRDDNPGGVWATQDGQPLIVGQEYEMYSEKYSVPSIIRIERLKPDSMEYTLTGEYGLEHGTEVTRQEAEMDGLTFTPVHDESDPTANLNENGPSDQMANPHHDFALNAKVAAPGDGGLSFKYKEHDVPTHMKQRHHRREHGYERWVPGEYGNILALANGDVHAWKVPGLVDNRDDPKIIQDFNHSKFISDTGLTTHSHDAPHGDEPEIRGGHLTPDGQVYWHGVENGTPEHDALMALVPGLTAGTYHMDPSEWDTDDLDLDDDDTDDDKNDDDNDRDSESDDDIAKAARRIAGAKFTPMEQREFIDEPGVARNSDKLDLEGTHYEHRSGLSLIDDSYYLFGL